MAEHSAGLLLHRDGQVFLAHMGGPFWARKTEHAWSIPKGLVDAGEDPLAAALREFEEEIGMLPPAIDYEPLIAFRTSSGKDLTIYAGTPTAPVEFVASNTFEVEWPPRSGKVQSFPEVDRAEWFDLAEARTAIVKGQWPALDALAEKYA
jgi:predicted NUDIX family NTP pyrophosphohydrolase